MVFSTPSPGPTPAPTPAPAPTPTIVASSFVDTSSFFFFICPSSMVLEKVEGKVMTASINPFIEGLYYALYVDGIKVKDDIQTSTFDHVFTIPGCRNVHITSSTESTVNRGNSNNPINVFTVCIPV